MADTPLKIVLVTASYPFGTEEEFPGQEAPSWLLDRMDLTLAPLGMPGPLNPMPPGVSLDTRLATYRTRGRKLAATGLAALHPLFLREVALLLRRRSLTLTRLVQSLLVVGQTLLIRRGLRDVLDEVGRDAVVYTYWHSSATYAAVLLKRAGRVRRVVSRGHGSDVYEAIAPGGWHALKRQLAPEIDHSWAVSESGARELVARYGTDPARVSVSRLGVVLPEAAGPPPAPDEFRVLSISTCTPLKQVPLIAEAVASLASANPGTRIHWTHLGDGPGLVGVRELFERLRGTRPDLDGWLPGFIPHDAVGDLLADQPFDVFVNSSTSEGVPVSIMEAMSYGIPVIAPEVGGVSELVRPDTGWLLPSTASGVDVADALAVALSERGLATRRAAARDLVADRFDATANFREFAVELVRRAEPLQG